MAKFDIIIPDKLLPGLQRLVDRYNQNAGKTLTVTDWILLHLKELAVSDEVTAERKRIEAALEAEKEQAVQTLVNQRSAELEAFRANLIAGA